MQVFHSSVMDMAGHPVSQPPTSLQSRVHMLKFLPYHAKFRIGIYLEEIKKTIHMYKIAHYLFHINPL